MTFLGLPASTLLRLGETFAFLGALTFVICLPILIGPRMRPVFPVVFAAVLAFCLLGWTVGYNMASSREPAVGTVLPAVLTLVAGLLVYILGSKGEMTRFLVSFASIGFAVSLLVASFAGAWARYAFETQLSSMDLLQYHERNRQALAVEKLMFEVDFRRLRDMAGRENGMDLSDVNSRD